MKKPIIIGAYLFVILICCLVFTRHLFLYNIGNSQFEKEHYDQAITFYEKALRANPPKQKECSIRINLALSMVYNLGEDYAHPDCIDDSISTLKQARTVLLEEDCATAEGDGHSETAEQLKEEIEELIRQLQEQSEGTEGDENDSPEETTSNEEDAKEQDIKEQLQQIQNNAYQERQEEMNANEEFDMDINFDFEGHIW